MLIEHVFVTTLAAPEALGLAASTLQACGFRIREHSPYELELVRGLKHARSTRVTRLPQIVRIAFDRGRVTVAGSIEPRGSKERPVYQSLMLGIVKNLERLLANREQPSVIVQDQRLFEKKLPGVWLATDVLAVSILVLFLLGIVAGILSAAFMAHS